MSNLEEVRERLKDTYLKRLYLTCERLASARHALDGSGGEAEATIRQLAHKLRGSGASYGFPEISTAAEAAERCSLAELPDSSGALLEVLRRLRRKPPPGFEEDVSPSSSS